MKHTHTERRFRITRILALYLENAKFTSRYADRICEVHMAFLSDSMKVTG